MKKIANLLRTGEKQYNYGYYLTVSAQETKNKQTKNNLLTLTIPSEKRSGLTWYSESGQVSQAGGFCERS